MMNLVNILKTIKKILVNNFELGLSVNDISNHTQIFGKGLGLDSTSAIELVIAIKKNFNFEIEELDLKLENFETVMKLAKFIYNKINCF